MEIFVNEQELDAELGGEKNLAEIYEAINSWTQEHRKYILNMKVDDEEVAVTRLEEIPSEGVRRVDFYIGDETDMMLATIEELDRYVDQVGSTLFSRQTLSEEDVPNLREGMEYIRQIIVSVSSLLHINLAERPAAVTALDDVQEEPLERILQRMDDRVAGFKAGSGRAEIEAFLADLRDFKLFLMQLMLKTRTLGAGLEELLETVEDFERDLPQLLEEIVSINEQFNSGKDAGALETLDRITGRLHDSISALFALDYKLRARGAETIAELEIGGVSFRTRADTLTGLLRDLSSAFEENDIVAVGDILEYELTGGLEALRPYLAEIRQLVLASK